MYIFICVYIYKYIYTSIEILSLTHKPTKSIKTS